MKHFRILIGLAFWCALFGVLWAAMGGQGETSPSNGRKYLSDLGGYYASTRRLELRLPKSCALAAGDPVFAADRTGSLQQVGIIVSCSAVTDSHLAANDTISAQAALFPSASETSLPVKAHYVSTGDSIEWVVQTMLPAERRKQIEIELAAALQEHHLEILEALQPVVNKSVREALAVLEQDLPLVLEKHRPELQAIAGKDKEEILKRELIPMVKAEVWPIIRKGSEPLVRQVSAELWERLSLWAIAWRGVADKLPLLRGKHRVEEELQRFLEREAGPIFERHVEDFLAAIEIILRDVADNDKVRAAFKRSAAKVVEDPELQRVLNEILHEVVVRNPRVWKTVRQNLGSAEAQEVLRLTGNRLEPTVRRIGDLLLGTREGGLTPEFNRVLRHEVLLKDGHGIILGDLPLSAAKLPCIPLEAWFSGTKR
jgi:hypothetical protein